MKELKIFTSPNNPYREVEDFFKKYKEELKGYKITFINVDLEENVELIKKYKVRKIPTIIGQYDQMIVGYLPQYLYSLLEPYTYTY